MKLEPPTGPNAFRIRRRGPSSTEQRGKSLFLGLRVKQPPVTGERDRVEGVGRRSTLLYTGEGHIGRAQRGLGHRVP